MCRLNDGRDTQLVYLIVTVATGKAALPLISIIMIAAVYGLQVGVSLLSPTSKRLNSMFLQALIFIVKREFMLVGWMVVYIISYVAVVSAYSAS